MLEATMLITGGCFFALSMGCAGAMAFDYSLAALLVAGLALACALVWAPRAHLWGPDMLLGTER